jgi:hypothetical protein
LTTIDPSEIIDVPKILKETNMASSAKNATGPELVKGEQPKSKLKPTKSLPFDRVQFTKQLEILRAYAAASAQGTKTATNIEVAAIVGMAAETVSMCNGFFTSLGFIQKGDSGWIVSQEVQAFFRAGDWNKDTASHKLSPLVQASWFAQALLPRLSFKPIDEEEAIGLLADVASAGQDYKRHLKMLVDYLEAAGLVLRDGTMLKLRAAATSESNPARQEPTKESAAESPVPAGIPKAAKVVTAFSQMAQGAMRFNVSFDVDMSEMANWRADRIAAFFSGIAQVLAAKAEVEKTAGS